MKKLIFILILICTVTSFITVISAEEADTLPFSDVEEGAWYYDSVVSVYKSGIMQGRDIFTFAPASPMSRAELVTVLCRLSDTEYEGFAEELTFNDTDKNAWYADCVGWAAKHELVKGYPDNTFRPDNLITRQEMTEILGRFISYKLLRDRNDPKVESFADAGKIPEWAAENVEKLRIFGLISGDENGNFNPTDTATRAELAKIAAQLDSFIYLNNRYKNFRFVKSFMYSDSTAPLPYRIYIPEDYDESKKYPLLIFLHGNSAQGDDNEKHLHVVKNAFLNPYSPVFDSIVVVPQCPEGFWWSGTMLDRLAELMDYINSLYSTDSARQYVSGISMGGDGSWGMAMHHPEKVSAVMPVAGTAYGFWSGVEGVEAIIGLNPETLKVNIRMIYDTDDGFSDGAYNRKLYRLLTEAGAVNLTYYETSGLGHSVCGEYAGYFNVSHLVWLFSQTKETAANNQ